MKKTIIVVTIIALMNLAALWAMLSYRAAQRTDFIVDCGDGLVPIYSGAIDAIVCVPGSLPRE